MTLAEIFQSRVHEIDWFALPATNVIGRPRRGALEVQQAYFRLRLTQVYLAYTRRLWVTLYPMVFAFIDHGALSLTAIAGPGQLSEIAGKRLDRVLTLNYALTEPIVYGGEDIVISTGLCSIPGGDSARVLIDTTAALSPLVAALGGPHLGSAIKIAKVLKDSVERMLAIDTSSLRLGIQYSISVRSAEPTIFVGTNLRNAAEKRGEFWLKDGALHRGSDLGKARRFEEADFMVLELERLDARDDFARLPGIAEFQDRFAHIMRESARSPRQKRAALAAVWPEFVEALANSKLLTSPDRERISGLVAGDLERRLALVDKGPFEKKSLGGAPNPLDFSYADVISSDPRRPRTMPAGDEMTRNPFE